MAAATDEDYGDAFDNVPPSPKSFWTSNNSTLTKTESFGFSDSSFSLPKTSKSIHRSASKASRASSARTTASRAPSATQPPNLALWKEIGFIFIICMAQLLTQASFAQSIAPVRVIGRSFDADNTGQLSWLTAAYSLTVGTFILPAGRWGDICGHRLLFLAGFLWFALWSLIAGFAVYSHSLVFFATCRALQGIGPAMLIPNGLAILGRTYPPGKKKNMIFALFGASAPTGFVFGSLFSGMIAQLSWWPWAYWISAVAITICAGLVMLFVPATPVAGGRPSIAELDLCGTALGVTGLILFNFSWNQGPTVGWSVAYVDVLLILGCLFLFAFFWWEIKMAEYPLLPRAAFSRETSLVLACMAAGWASFGIWMYYLWQYLEVLRGDSILLATAQVSPVLPFGLVAAAATGLLLHSAGPGIVMLVSMMAFLIGNILLATSPVGQTYWAQTFVATLITPFGMDMSFPAGGIILSNHMPREFQGVAASILCVVQNYWMSIGLGMAGTVESNVNGGDTLKGYRGAWYLAIGLDCLGVFCAFALVLSWRSTVKAKKEADGGIHSDES